MSTISIASVKGAPGVSTLTWLLTRTWPRTVVGVEADESGGGWAQRFGLSWEPGLVSWAATRKELNWDVVADHGHEVSPDGLVVCAPPTPMQVTAALSALENRLIGWPHDADLLLDIGRIGSPTSRSLLRHSNLVLLVTSPRTDSVAVLHQVAGELRRDGCTPHLVSIGSEPHDPVEIARYCDMHLAGVLPDDAVAVERLLSGRRSRLMATAVGSLAARVSAATAYIAVTENDVLISADSLVGD